MKKYSILIVEDDKAIRSLIQTALEAEQFGVITAYNGASAIVQARTQAPSIILLDLGLPDTDGIQVIDEIRKKSTVPIIVVSARSEDTDKIDALNHGADDYVSKPFNVEELMARIRASLRRMEFQSGMDQSTKQFKNGGLVINFDSMEVRVNGEVVHLTPIEYKILAMLAQYMCGIYPTTGGLWQVPSFAKLYQILWDLPQSIQSLAGCFFVWKYRGVEGPGVNDAPVERQSQLRPSREVRLHGVEAETLNGARLRKMLGTIWPALPSNRKAPEIAAAQLFLTNGRALCASFCSISCFASQGLFSSFPQ